VGKGTGGTGLWGVVQDWKQDAKIIVQGAEGAHLHGNQLGNGKKVVEDTTDPQFSKKHKERKSKEYRGRVRKKDRFSRWIGASGGT